MKRQVEPTPTRSEVFVWGGQPTHTYVSRSELQIEQSVARAISAPNQIVSLSGPSKSGKTVLCRKVLNSSPYVWVEGGQIKTASELWDKICYELNCPTEISKDEKRQVGREATAGVKFIFSGGGSHLKATGASKTYTRDSMAAAIRHLTEEKIALVIDDFHYIPPETRKDFLRNIKGAVFNHLKLVLISVSHRGNDAVRAERELQGRVISVGVPDWKSGELSRIANLGFSALNVSAPEHVVDRISSEAQGSPFLMQQLCWEICAGIGVDAKVPKTIHVPMQFELSSICRGIAKGAGKPVYHKLVAGPQSRRVRNRHALRSGGEADIYGVVLLAVARTGPKSTIMYDDIREQIGEILVGAIPQKNEITSALKHLSKISQKIGDDAGIDWDEDGRQVDISDPYLRFFLRWQIRPVAESTVSGQQILRLQMPKKST